MWICGFPGSQGQSAIKYLVWDLSRTRLTDSRVIGLKNFIQILTHIKMYGIYILGKFTSYHAIEEKYQMQFN